MMPAFPLLLCLQGAAPAPDAVPAPHGSHFRSAQLVDLDGDGRLDLLVAVLSADRRERRLDVHLQRQSGAAFAPEPDQSLTLGSDVTVFAAGDFHADPGREVVLCNRSGAFLWRPRVHAAGRVTRLAAAEVLWQVPEAAEVVAWPGLVVDLDGDGRDDLVLPGPDGYTLLRQERGSDGAVTLTPMGTPTLPRESEAEPGRSPFAVRRGRGRGMRIDLDLGGAPASRGPLVQIDDSVPAPQWRDFDGDGRTDLWALRGKTLWIWLQDAQHRFATEPGLRQPLPVTGERRLDLDVSYSAHATDLDGDRKGDLVLLAGERGGDRTGTQVLVFVQGAGQGQGAQTATAPLFGPDGIPQQLLVLSGIAGAPHLLDLDGDGRRDLCVLSFRPDLMDVLKAAASEQLTAEVLVFRGQGRTLARKPDLARSFVFGASGGGGGDRERMRCLADLDGDLAAELAVRSRSDQLQLFHFRRRRDGLALDDEPWLALSTTASGQLLEAWPRDSATSGILVLDPDRLQVVRGR